MKALVLSSGGLDSTVCLALAVQKFGKENVATVIVNYGQRHIKEIESGRKVAEYYGVPHYEFNVEELFKYSNCSLMADGQPVIETTYEKQVEEGKKITSYVPFRNGLMLSICATLGQSLWEEEECDVYLGNHASDFAYADCTPKFVKKMQAAIFEGTYGWVKFVSPLQDMTKSEVVKLGSDLSIPFELTWSCYEGEELPCGRCASCLERKRAFEANGLIDPVQYQE